MRGQPNISSSAMFPGIFPVYIGLETLALLSLAQCRCGALQPAAVACIFTSWP